MNTALLIILAICAIVIMTINSKQLIDSYKKEKETELRTFNAEAARILLLDNFVDRVNSIIDSLIKEQVDIYQVLILSTADDLHYIKAEDQEKMCNYVIYRVKNNISPELRDLIGLVYNVKNDDDLESVISTRAKLYLINFIVDYNQEFTE